MATVNRTGPQIPAAASAMIEQSSRIRSPWTYSVTYHLGGAAGDVDEDATAYSNRAAARTQRSFIRIRHHSESEFGRLCRSSMMEG